jgi:hypothetical protein
VIGATGGDAIVPIMIGFLMDALGTASLPVCSIIFSGLMIGLYMIMHYIAMQRKSRVSAQTDDDDDVESKDPIMPIRNANEESKEMLAHDEDEEGIELIAKMPPIYD